VDDGATPISSIEGLAEHYLREIRRVQPAGPYLIGGFSLGAFPAFEMARQLVSHGEKAAQVFLIDGSAHTLPRYQAAIPKAVLLQYRLKHLALGSWFHLRQLFQISPRDLRQYLDDGMRRKRRRENRLNGEFEISDSLPEELRAVEKANQIALYNYLPKPYAGKVIQLRTTGGYNGFDISRHGWVTLAGEVETHWIPDSDHYGLLEEPHVGAVAEVLRKAIAQAGLGPRQEETNSSLAR
jgi:thioesterase domain-containing protein